MNSTRQDLLALIGRILLMAIFIKSGIEKIGAFEGTVGYIASKGLPLPQVAAGVAIAVEVVAAALVVIGWKTRLAAFAVLVFTLAAAILFHNYWTLPAEKQMMDMINFWKNLAICGGLLMLIAFGPGGWSVDGRKR